MIVYPLESKEQEALCRWMDDNNIFYFAVPNGGSRHKLEAVNLKKQGVKKGVSDLIVMLNSKILFVEMKRVKGSITSDEQIDFIDRVTQFGYSDGRVCYGCEDAKNYIKEWL